MMSADISSNELEQLIKLRHWLHAHPEVSRQEVKTAEYMKSYLQEHCTPDKIISLAGAGFAAVYEGKAPGNTVLLRTELDALPIHEINSDLSYKSLYDGVGHKCGHDGHMTIITGVAMKYAQQRPEKGRIVLLYQPDEETGTGARECCDHENFKQIEPDYAFALHNFPNFETNEILCKTGIFTSAVKFVAFKLSGKESHSAMPETGINPATAIAEITQMAQEVQNEFDDDQEYALIVPIYFNMGVSSSGVSPGYGEAHYTIRTCRNEVVQDIWDAFIARAGEIAEKHGLTYSYEAIEDFAANNNNSELVEMIQHAADANNLTYTVIEKPFRGGEDFGEVTKRYKGAMFGLGAGMNKPELHNPDYDFPDEIISAGIKMFVTLAENALSKDQNETEPKAA